MPDINNMFKDDFADAVDIAIAKGEFVIELKIDNSRVEHTATSVRLRLPGVPTSVNETLISTVLEHDGLSVNESEDIALKMIDTLNTELRVLALRKIMR